MGDSFQIHVLMILGWKHCLNAVGVCARNIIKTVVFECFHLVHLSKNLLTSGVVLGVILVSFGNLRTTFSDFRGSWGRA